MRIILSQGRGNIFNLAKNAGTSVEQIERLLCAQLAALTRASEEPAELWSAQMSAKRLNPIESPAIETIASVFSPPPVAMQFGIGGCLRPYAFEARTPMSIEFRPQLKNCTILVVEDEMLLRLDLAHQLRSAGFEVIEADSGDDALAVLKAKNDVD